MYIAIIPNRNSPPAILLREGYRENGKVKNRTLANLSSLPMEQIDDIRRILKGEKLHTVDDERCSIARNHCVRKGTAAKKGATVTIETTPDPVQQRAFDLLLEEVSV